MRNQSGNSRRFSSERGFANEGCVLSLAVGLFGLLTVLVLVFLGRTVSWQVVLLLVVIGLPGFLFVEGLSAMFVLAILGLAAGLAIGRSGEASPPPMLYAFGILGLIGAVGVVARVREWLKGDKEPPTH